MALSGADVFATFSSGKSLTNCGQCHSGTYFANVQVNGGSSALVNVSGRLDANVTGGSSLEYSGQPTLGTVDSSGGSTITKQ